MQSKLTSLCLIAGLTILIVSCKGKSDKKVTETDTTTANTTTADTSLKNKPAVWLECKVGAEDSSGNPHADVILFRGGYEQKVASINACSEIPKSEYKTYEIPENAISAIGGFWAGLGSYFYLVEKDGVYSVYEGFTEEGQKEKGYHWKKWSAK